MQSKILILGFSEDTHSEHLVKVLQSRGKPVAYLDFKKFPTVLKLSFSPNPMDLSVLKINDETFQPSALFWRWYRDPEPSTVGVSESVYELAKYNSISMARGFLKSNLFPMLNPAVAFDVHWNKASQLHLFWKNKIPIPRTLLSNHIDDIQNFMRLNASAEYIVKPCQGGVLTQRISLDTLEELAQQLDYNPVTVQELIPGVNIRVYCLENQFWACKVMSQSLDFREDDNHQLIPIDRNDRLYELCTQVLKISGYHWSGIDIIENPLGEYIVLEANPSPMFLHVERLTGFPLTQAITQWLVSKAYQK